ncbi:helix-turn-helix transcriptional regulator [Leptolyngbya sp. FACHB-671]|uniref:ArsR/SmtB family transcription factor n=1 Tax=Leptolyngbya sp. FACHB-671 TaxID=2692812 RepID=UPI001683CB8A|nr:helix-turn-helix transcriptional regulator [Leptolyngbya sp. FACHB-671]MBD2071831.1 helix-turn-helix transcriptional regulator [Leptolyngbya sp. FACHB-671]
MQANEQPFVVRLLQAVEGGRQMEARGLNGNDDPLISILKTVRRTTWEKYLKILLMASDSDGTTMNQISLELGEKPQSIHRLLKRMMDREALTRKKRGTEFYYHLTPDISREEIESQLKVITDGDAINAVPLLDLGNGENIEQSQFDEDQLQVSQVMNVQEASNKKGDRPSKEVSMSQSMEWKEKMLRLRLSKLPALPEFNPDWSDEKQGKWFTLYEKIIELQEGQNND